MDQSDYLVELGLVMLMQLEAVLFYNRERRERERESVCHCFPLGVNVNLQLVVCLFEYEIDRQVGKRVKLISGANKKEVV